MHVIIRYSKYSSIGYLKNIEATQVMDLSIISESIQVLDFTIVLLHLFL